MYYGTYVFFEKLRIARKRPKSKKRRIMEDIYAMQGGMDRKGPSKPALKFMGKVRYDEYGMQAVY